MNRRNILIGLGVVGAGAIAGGGWWWMNRGPGAPQVAATPAPGAASGGTAAGTMATTAAGEMPVFEDDHILGAADAPVTIIEFASLTCPHCATFHAETYPQVKSEWVETGRARFIFRHYPLDQLALRAAAASECIKGDGFFGFLDVLFSNQEKWSHAPDPLAAIAQYAALGGLDKATFEACITDEAAIDRILQKQTEGRDRYGIASTPSFVVNGTPVVGALGYDEFKSVLETAATKSS